MRSCRFFGVCSVRVAPICLYGLVVLLLPGCGGSVARVSGRVTAKGQEVTAGTLIFTPVGSETNNLPGKPGAADVQPDGTYSLEVKSGTQGLSGQCNVRFTPPPVDVTSKTKNVVIPYSGLVPSQDTVDIKPGDNVIDIELVPIKKS